MESVILMNYVYHAGSQACGSGTKARGGPVHSQVHYCTACKKRQRNVRLLMSDFLERC